MSVHQDNVASPLTLVSGADRCELLPRVGGSIGAWIVNDQHMLRPARLADVARRSPFGMGSFPLVPFSNRVGDACFEWMGNAVRLERNFLPERHAIHGVGFERGWRVEAVEPRSALLGLTHSGDGAWPWPFEAYQNITIGDGVLTLELSAKNLASHPAPLAFGHHPYFPRDGAMLSFAAAKVWLVGLDGLPSHEVQPSGELDFSTPAAVAQRSVDHCYSGWSGVASIEWAHQPHRLEIHASPDLPCVVVYSRENETGFCFEPVPHVNNSLKFPGRAPAIPVVAPGETFRARIQFRAIAR